MTTRRLPVAGAATLLALSALMAPFPRTAAADDGAAAAKTRTEPADTRTEPADTAPEVPAPVDLRDDPLPSLVAEPAPGEDGISPWYDRLDITGFAAAGFLDSGPAGDRPEGGFAVKESALFLEADVWEGTSVFFEVQVNPLLQDARIQFQTGEVYAAFRDVWRSDRGDRLGFKVGRIDIPFGEEYLWDDTQDNPLISHSVGFPWLTDEGVAAFGRLRGVGWVAAITDGTMERSVDENVSKALNLKLFGRPWRPLYLSASAMKNDETSGSALYLGETCFQPVGAPVHGRDVTSTAGFSPSERVEASLYEVTATVSGPNASELWLTLGQAWVDDAEDTYDRSLTWFTVQARTNLPGHRAYVAARHSEFGTYDADEGYQIGGGFLTDGRRAFGYDTRRLGRTSAGFGWIVNPRVTMRVEVGRDRFELIDASPLEPDNGDRTFTAAEMVVTF